jgi:hypothetical protein
LDFITELRNRGLQGLFLSFGCLLLAARGGPTLSELVVSLGELFSMFAKIFFQSFGLRSDGKGVTSSHRKY